MKYIIFTIFIYFLYLIVIINGCLKRYEPRITPSITSTSTVSTTVSEDLNDTVTVIEYDYDVSEKFNDSSAKSLNVSTTISMNTSTTASMNIFTTTTIAIVNENITEVNQNISSTDASTQNTTTTTTTSKVDNTTKKSNNTSVTVKKKKDKGKDGDKKSQSKPKKETKVPSPSKNETNVPRSPENEKKVPNSSKKETKVSKSSKNETDAPRSPQKEPETNDNKLKEINELSNFISSNQYLSGYVDLDVNPCDNFHEFTCNKWSTLDNSMDNVIDNEIIDNKYNFTRFVEEVFEGKLNEKSSILKDLYNLGAKCHLSTNDIDTSECLKLVKEFGSYAIATHFKNNIANDNDYEMNNIFINSMTDNIKKQFKTFFDERKKFLNEVSGDNFTEILENIKFIQGNHQDLMGLSLMEDCYKYFNFSLNDNVIDILNQINNYEALIDSDNQEFRRRCMRYIKMYPQKYLNNQNTFELLSSDLAFYRPEYNKIIFNPLIGIFQNFNSTYLTSLLHGKLGFVIGRQILDSLGVRYFDDDQRSECIMKQLINSSKGLNGHENDEMAKLNEIITDNLGIKIAHQAYTNYLDNIDNKLLNNNQITKQLHDQLFFIGIGKSLCEMGRDEIDNENQKNSLESRIIKSLGTYKPFLDTFNCKEGTKMYLKDQCEL